jgi:hypothetical protein
MFFPVSFDAETVKSLYGNWEKATNALCAGAMHEKHGSGDLPCLQDFRGMEPDMAQC